MDAARTVLTAYQSQGYLEVTGDPATAEAVVFLAGSPYVDSDAAKRNVAVLTIAEQFDQAASRIVVGAPTAAGDGNVIRGVRDDPDLVKTISTVDNVNTVQGQLVTVLALAEQIDGSTGQYGRGSGATGGRCRCPQEPEWHLITAPLRRIPVRGFQCGRRARALHPAGAGPVRRLIAGGVGALAARSVLREVRTAPGAGRARADQLPRPAR